MSHCHCARPKRGVWRRGLWRERLLISLLLSSACSQGAQVDQREGSGGAQLSGALGGAEAREAGAEMAFNAATEAGAEAGAEPNTEAGAEAGAEPNTEAGAEAGAELSTGGERPSLSLEERLIMNLPSGPEPERFDCRAALNFQTPTLAERHPSCVLDLACVRPMIVAHRGAGGDLGYLAPENSLSAIRAALLIGVDGVELDVRVSADEALIVIHDSTVDRTTGAEGLVDQMREEELTQLSLLPPALRHPRSSEGDFSCDRVPTLREALLLTQGQLFVDLDMKTDRVELVIDLLSELELFDEVYISVSNPTVAARARALEPRARVQVRPDTLEELAALEPLFPTRVPDIIEVPPNALMSFRPVTAASGARLFTNGWGADIRAQTGDLSAYRALFESGAEIIQVEVPLAALEALER